MKTALVWMNLIDDTADHFRLQFTTLEELPAGDLTMEHDLKFPMIPATKTNGKRDREQTEYARACVAAWIDTGSVPTVAPAKLAK